MQQIIENKPDESQKKQKTPKEKLSMLLKTRNDTIYIQSMFYLLLGNIEHEEVSVSTTGLIVLPFSARVVF